MLKLYPRVLQILITPEWHGMPRKGANMLNRYSRRKRALKGAAVLLSFIMTAAFTLSASANETEFAAAQNNETVSLTEGIYQRSANEKPVTVYINNSKYQGRAFISKSVTYVGIREFSMAMGASSVSWNSATKTATLTSDSLSVSAKNHDLYIIANDRYLWAQSGIIIKSGTMYVPLRTLAKAFGCSVSWDQYSFSAYVSGKGSLQSGSEYYNSDDLYWLSRIIHAEAKGEPLLGKVAVGTVVLNRVRSSLFPNSIYNVIFDKKNGIQFTPTANGTIYNNPSAESIIAAKICLDGGSISEKALFFVNEALAQSSWVSDNRQFIVAVGNHKFYA